PIDPAVLFDTVGRHYGPDASNDGQAVRSPTPTMVQSSARHTPGRDAASPPAISDVALPAVDGLDTFDGLLRVAGSRSLYLKLLRQFVDQQAEAPARIALALKTGDTTVAERLAHTVAGVAGSLGAGPVHAAASALAHAIALGGDVRHIE